MVGKTNVAGARLRAVIAVTYPEGSVCTCTNGTKTRKAKDTSGKALFNVPVGEWTVTATDGSRTKSASVNITTEGQSESVTLSYELVILDGSTGNGSSNWTANAVGDSSISLSSSAGIVVNPNGWKPWVVSKNAWDLTNYNTLMFYISRPTNAMNIRCGVGTPHSDNTWITDWDAYTDTTSEETSFTVIVDIASITSTYIGMEFTYGTKATISKIIAS